MTVKFDASGLKPSKIKESFTSHSRIYFGQQRLLVSEVKYKARFGSPEKFTLASKELSERLESSKK